MINETSSKMNLPKLILASGSPRRSEILNSVGWEFEKIVPDVNESVLDGETPETYVQRIAEKKASALVSQHPDRFILAADTTVVIDDEILGKPIDFDDARKMIEKLSGSWHEVLTGVSINNGENSSVGLERTRVKFALMNEDEIEFLTREGEPLDKAGAYAIQAQAALFIEKIEGDYWNIVGLPISLVYRMIKNF